MNSDLTISFIVDNPVREELLLKNPIFNNNSMNKKIFFVDTYKPYKYNNDYIIYSQDNLIETVRESLDTNYSIILKPEEQIQVFLPMSNIESDTYINIDFIKNISNSFENSNIFEKRLIVKNNLSNEKVFLENIILSSFFYNIKELIKYIYNQKSENFAKANFSIEDIIFLSEFGNIKDIYKYSYFLDDENIDKKLKLNLILSIIKKYYMNMDLKEVTYFLDKGLELEKNSINMNYFSGELESTLLKNKDAIKSYEKCLELSENNTYYKEENIPKQLRGYLINYAIGLSYNKLKNYKLAHDNFKRTLEINPTFILAQEKMKETIDQAKKEMYYPYDHDKELMFSCQSCGNCCRFFDVNITDTDVARILENRPDLKFDDFIEFIENKGKLNKDSNIKLTSDKSAMMILKQKEGGKECIFLTEDNKCSIHEFKPTGCRTWPFTLNYYNSEIKWNNLFRPFLKIKCAHKLEENANDESFIIKKLEDLIYDIELFSLKIDEWNKKDIDNLSKDDLIKYLISDKKDKSLYNETINYFKELDSVNLIIEDPFYSIYDKNISPDYKFLEIISDDKGLEDLKDIDNLLLFKEKLGIDFIYFSKFPIPLFKIYRSGTMIYLYFSNIKNFNLYDKSEIIYKNTERNFEAKIYDDLFKIEINRIKESLFLKKNEFLNLININSFEKSNETAISILYEYIFPLLYLINKKTFFKETISILKYIPKNLFIFITEIEKFQKNELSQKRLYFITELMIEEIFMILCDILKVNVEKKYFA